MATQPGFYDAEDRLRALCGAHGDDVFAKGSGLQARKGGLMPFDGAGKTLIATHIGGETGLVGNRATEYFRRCDQPAATVQGAAAAGRRRNHDSYWIQ